MTVDSNSISCKDKFLDSRGNPTVEVDVYTENGGFCVEHAVPVVLSKGNQ